MLSYIKAENLKMKRTMCKNLIFLLPIASLLPSFVLINAGGYASTLLNFWYEFASPIGIALVCGLINQKEQKYHKYRLVYSLSVNLNKIWITKNIIVAIYVFAMSAVMFIFANIGEFFIPATLSFKTGTFSLFIGYFVIFLTTLWQIPFCLFISKKFNLIFAVVTNTILSIVLSLIDITNSSFWWMCPYAWGPRIICTTNNLMVNGLPVENTGLYLNAGIIVVICTVSVALFVLLTYLSANLFSKSEER